LTNNQSGRVLVIIYEWRWHCLWRCNWLRLVSRSVHGLVRRRVRGLIRGLIIHRTDVLFKPDVADDVSSELRKSIDNLKQKAPLVDDAKEVNLEELPAVQADHTKTSRFKKYISAVDNQTANETANATANETVNATANETKPVATPQAMPSPFINDDKNSTTLIIGQEFV
jgi:hypothetical protein